MARLDTASFDPVLHSAPRITIMTRLVIHRSMRFGALQESVQLTPGNLASHLEVLEKQGYVTQERDERSASPTKTIFVTAHGETAFRAYIKQLKVFIATIDSEPARNPLKAS